MGELMKGFVKRRPVTEEMKEALEKADLCVGRSSLKSSRAPSGHCPCGPCRSFHGLCQRCGRDAFLRPAGQRLRKARGRILGIVPRECGERDVCGSDGKSKGNEGRGTHRKGRREAGRDRRRSVIVPEMETYKIQELHLPVYHALCLMLEHRFYEQ